VLEIFCYAAKNQPRILIQITTDTTNAIEPSIVFFYLKMRRRPKVLPTIAAKLSPMPNIRQPNIRAM
jgi:hypothetical protein